MNFRLLIAGVVLSGLAAPAVADEYYVVRNPDTEHCTIVTKKPVEKEIITQIGPVAFATRQEAETRIKKTEVCHTSTTGSSTTIIKHDDDR